MSKNTTDVKKYTKQFLFLFQVIFGIILYVNFGVILGVISGLTVRSVRQGCIPSTDVGNHPST